MKTVFKYCFKGPITSGFTLLEIMISISIISLVLLSLFRMQSGTIELASAVKFDSIAPVLAKQLLVKIKLDTADFSEAAGEFDFPYQGIKWTSRIEDSAFEDLDDISKMNQSRFKRIHIQITDPSAHRTYAVSTWRFVDE